MMSMDNTHAGFSSQSPFVINALEMKKEGRRWFVELEFKNEKLSKSH